MLRDGATGQVRATFLDNLRPGHAPGFWTLTFSSDGRRLAVGLENAGNLANAYMIDLEGVGAVTPLITKDKDRSIARCRFLAGAGLLVGTGYTYDAEDRAYLWDLETGDDPTTFGAEVYDSEEDPTQQVILSPDGWSLVTQYEEVTGAASLWQMVVAEGKYQWQRRHAFTDFPPRMDIAIFSPNGRTLAALRADGLELTGGVLATSTVTLWDVSSGQRIIRLTMPGRCYCFAFSPDSRTLVTLSGIPMDHYWGGVPEYFLRLWDLDLGQEQATLRTESRWTNQLCHEPRSAQFSSDGRYLAVSHLCHAELWDLAPILDTDGN